MVGVTAILVGYMLNQFFPTRSAAAINSPPFMIGFCVVFAFGVAYIAYRGVTGTTGVNIAINVIQITALLVFSVIALGLSHEAPRRVDRLPARPTARRRFKSSWRKEPVDGERHHPKDETATGAAWIAQNKMNGDTAIPLPRACRTASPIPFILKLMPRIRRRTMEPVDYGPTRRTITPHFQFHAIGRLGRRAARLQLRVHPGLHRDPDPRRIRVRHRRWARRPRTPSATFRARCCSRC